MSKLNDLEVLVKLNNFDIVCITETWLSEKIPDAMLSFNGIYRVFRKDRESRGGGVCILVKGTLSATAITFCVNDVEIIAVNIGHGNEKLIVANIYRPPGSTVEHKLYILNLVSCLNQLFTNTKSKVVLVGDLNLPHIDWSNLTCPVDGVGYTTPFYSLS